MWEQNLELPNGVVVSYWVLVSTYVESLNKTGVCKVKGYLDQAAYESGKEHILEQEYTINFAPIDPNGQLLAAVIGLSQAAQQARISQES